MLHIDPNTRVKPETAQRYMSLHILPYVLGDKAILRESMTYFLEMHPEQSYKLLLAYACSKPDLSKTLMKLTSSKNLKQTLDEIISN